jgi:hypothetical protein
MLERDHPMQDDESYNLLRRYTEKIFKTFGRNASFL